MKAKLVTVALPLPLRQDFTYRLPDNLDYTDSLLGARVRVSFEKRILIGFISGTEKIPSYPRIKTIQELIDSPSLFTKELYDLLLWAADYYHNPLGQVLETALPVALRKGRKAQLQKTKLWRISAAGMEQDLNQLRGVQQQKALSLLRKEQTLYRSSLAELNISLNTLTTLVKRGWATEEDSILMPQLRARPESPVRLLEEQRQAADAVISSFGSFRCFLLEGPTNSGKTEIYLEIIRQALKQGKQSLYMVPEISLSPQTLKRLERGLHIPLGLMHSKMTATERLQNYLLAAQDKLQVVIGTRSTIFIPFRQLGCIIIDEEQDTSYKQQEGFRYSGKHLAIKYAQLLGIPIVLGSATPALESYHNISLQRYHHLHLTRKIHNEISLSCRLMDMKRQHKKHPFTEEVTAKIEKTLAMGSQVLVFINRRGYAPTLSCQGCGWVQECNQCDRPMTLHKYPPLLSCHLCERQQAIPHLCPNCQSHQLSPGGFGTQRMADFLEKKFENYPVLRIDRDSMQKRDAYSQFYDQVSRNKPCILVGTQIIAKGHDFAYIRLAVIVNGDQGLMSPDFHAAETSAQLITQVIGRVGRRKDARTNSSILMPTYHPDNPMLNSLLTQGYAAFAKRELQTRKHLGFPPYTYFAYLRAAATKGENALEFLRALRQQSNQHNAKLLGPIECAMSKKGSYHRKAVIIKAQSRAALYRTLEQLTKLADRNKNKGVRWHIDIDPVEAP